MGPPCLLVACVLTGALWAAGLQDLAEGKGRETKAIDYPEARQRISYHP